MKQFIYLPAKYIRGAHYFAGVQGLEPQLTVPETVVLPLDDTPMCSK